MKTLLIALYPYQGKGLDSWHDHGAGMTYTAAKNAGCDIDFLDMKTLFTDRELGLVMRGYDLISFGLKSSYYALGMKVIKNAKELGIKTLVAGYHVTAAAKELVENPDIDYIFHGESEITFPIFLKTPHLFEREIFGERPPNLDDLVFFNRDIYQSPIEDCKGWWHGGRAKMLSVMTSRGCPFKCGFCQPLEDNHFGKKLRRRSVDSVISELKMLKEKYSPECIMIHDDTFLVQKPWIEEFIEKYPQIGLPFWASGRADGICKDPELVNQLVKVGWELVSVGFESGSQRILDIMKKGTTVEQNLEAAKIVKSAGGKLYANYMTGLPQETKQDIQATARMADKINAEMAPWSFFTPYPGCEMGEDCIEQGLSLLDRNNYNRCPYGQKVKGVDYFYIDAVLKGLRGEGNIVVPAQCDIIIPTYENEEYTVACLESIKQHTTPNTYRIIWVDNASSNTSAIERTIFDMPHLSIRMPKNEGFVLATNEGLKASNAPFVCLLNNDTEVHERWLEKLIGALQRDPKLGIIGPMTMPITGDRLYDSQHSLALHPIIPLDHSRSLEDTDKILESKYSKRTMPITFVAFLCAVIKREVINKVGLLDTNYTLGMWDDNDYNIAARQAGYKAELAMDTCILHKGHITFTFLNKRDNLNTTALMIANRTYLIKKWGKLSNIPIPGRGISWREKIAATQQSVQ